MIHPKVKVPAIVGVVIAIVLAVLSALTSVPAVAAYAAIGVTILTAISGYLTPAAGVPAVRKKAAHRTQHRA